MVRSINLNSHFPIWRKRWWSESCAMSDECNVVMMMMMMIMIMMTMMMIIIIMRCQNMNECPNQDENPGSEYLNI